MSKAISIENYVRDLVWIGNLYCQIHKQPATEPQDEEFRSFAVLDAIQVASRKPRAHATRRGTRYFERVMNGEFSVGRQKAEQFETVFPGTLRWYDDPFFRLLGGFSTDADIRDVWTCLPQHCTFDAALDMLQVSLQHGRSERIDFLLMELEFDGSWNAFKATYCLSRFFPDVSSSSGARIKFALQKFCIELKRHPVFRFVGQVLANHVLATNKFGVGYGLNKLDFVYWDSPKLETGLRSFCTNSNLRLALLEILPFSVQKIWYGREIGRVLTALCVEAGPAAGDVCAPPHTNSRATHFEQAQTQRSGQTEQTRRHTRLIHNARFELFTYADPPRTTLRDTHVTQIDFSDADHWQVAYVFSSRGVDTLG